MTCQHQAVHFSSGDYYVMCDACGAMWARVGGQPEYGVGKDGSAIGANPLLAQAGFLDPDPVRQQKARAAQP